MAEPCDDIQPPQFNTGESFCLEAPAFPVSYKPGVHGWVVGDSIVNYGPQNSLNDGGSFAAWMSGVSGVPWVYQDGMMCTTAGSGLYGPLLDNSSCFVKLFEFELPFVYNPTSDGIVYGDEVVPFPEGPGQFDTLQEIEFWVNSQGLGNFKAYQIRPGWYRLAGYVDCEEVCNFQGVQLREAGWVCLAERLQFPLTYSDGDGFMVDGGVVPFGGSGVFVTPQDLAANVNSNDPNGHFWQVIEEGGGFSLCSVVNAGDYKGLVVTDPFVCCCIIDDVSFPWINETGAHVLASNQILQLVPGFDNATVMADWFTDTTGETFEAATVDGNSFSICGQFTDCETAPTLINPVDKICILFDPLEPFPYCDCGDGIELSDGSFIEFPLGDSYADMTAFVTFLNTTDEGAVWEVDNEGLECSKRVCYTPLDGLTRNLVLRNRIHVVAAGLTEPILYCECVDNFITPEGPVDLPRGGMLETVEDLLSFMQSATSEPLTVDYTPDCVATIYAESCSEQWGLNITAPDPQCELYEFPLTVSPSAQIDVGGDLIQIAAEMTTYNTGLDLVAVLNGLDPKGRWQAAPAVGGYQICYDNACDNTNRSLQLGSTYVCIVDSEQYGKVFGEGSAWVVNNCSKYYVEDDGDPATSETIQFCTGDEHAEWFNSNDANGVTWTASHEGTGVYSICGWVPDDLVFMYT